MAAFRGVTHGKKSDSNEVVTDPRLEKLSRRRFSVTEKKRLLAEIESLDHDDKGAWLRRKGLYDCAPIIRAMRHVLTLPNARI